MSQYACHAMLLGQTADAVERYRRTAALHEAAGDRLDALMAEVSVCQATIYGGGATWAAARMAELLGPLRELGNPSGFAWAYYVLGEATAAADPGRALALLARIGEARDAVLLAGAVIANRHRYPAFVRNPALEQAVHALRGRLGDAVIDDALREGAALPFVAAVALAGSAIRRGS